MIYEIVSYVSYPCGLEFGVLENKKKKKKKKQKEKVCIGLSPTF